MDSFAWTFIVLFGLLGVVIGLTVRRGAPQGGNMDERVADEDVKPPAASSALTSSSLTDCEQDHALRAVLVGMLRQADGGRG